MSPFSLSDSGSLTDPSPLTSLSSAPSSHQFNNADLAVSIVERTLNWINANKKCSSDMMTHCSINLIQLRRSAFPVLPWNREPDLDVLFLLTVTAVPLRGNGAEKKTISEWKRFVSVRMWK